MEVRWYDCATGYRMLAMDPDTSGVTWAEIEAMLNDPAQGLQAVPLTVYRRRWGYEQPPMSQAAHIESCKAESLRLAVVKLTPQTPAEVTLRS